MSDSERSPELNPRPKGDPFIRSNEINLLNWSITKFYMFLGLDRVILFKMKIYIMARCDNNTQKGMPMCFIVSKSYNVTTHNNGWRICEKSAGSSGLRIINYKIAL